MVNNDELANAYSDLGEAAYSLKIAGKFGLAKRVEQIREEIEELIEW